MVNSSQYISLRETAQLLGVTEQKVMDMIQSGQLQAYKIADQFLRFKRADVVGLKNSGKVVAEIKTFEYTTAERIKDFFYFNDFYLVAVVIILVLLYLIFYTY